MFSIWMSVCLPSRVLDTTCSPTLCERFEIDLWLSSTGRYYVIVRNMICNMMENDVNRVYLAIILIQNTG